MDRVINFEELREIARKYRYSGINHIYLHWSAGRYGQTFSDYHICITGDGALHLMGDLDEVKSHTWHRNTGAIGVSMMCAFDAVCYSRTNMDFGTEPPRMEQIEAMAKTVAILCEELGLDMSYPQVMTHSEAADIDGYGIGSGDPETRWDLLGLIDSDGELKPGGNVIRGKAIWFHYHPENI